MRLRGLAAPLDSAAGGQTVKSAASDLTPWRWATLASMPIDFVADSCTGCSSGSASREAWEGSALPDVAAGLIRPDERAGEIDLNGVIAHACAVYRTLSRRADLREVFRDGEASYEVPFCLVIDGSPVRGTIDCLIRTTAPELTLGRSGARDRPRVQDRPSQGRASRAGGAVPARRRSTLSWRSRRGATRLSRRPGTGLTPAAGAPRRVGGSDASEAARRESNLIHT